MGLRCISVFGRGETKKHESNCLQMAMKNNNIGKGEYNVYRWLWVRVQKIKAKGKKYKENEVKLSGNGNLRWQKRKKMCIQEDFDKGGLG